MDCAVLGCPEDAVPPSLVVSDPGAVLFDTGVCSRHHAEIDNGAAWQAVVDGKSTVVLMGDDLPARVANFHLWQDAGTTDRGAGIMVRVDVERPDGTVDIVPLWLSRDMARDLSSALRMFAGDPGSSD